MRLSVPTPFPTLALPDLSRTVLPFLVVLGALVVAVLLGALAALSGEFAVLSGIVLLQAGLVLVFYRVGAWWMCLLFPLAQLSAMPRQLLGISGLNPGNILMLATLLSIMLAWVGARWRHAPCQLPPAPRPLLLLYVLPITLGVVHGIPSVPLIADYFYQTKAIAFTSAGSYVRDVLVRPMLLVVFAMVVAMVFRDARKPRFLLLPMMLAAWLLCMLIVYVVVSSGFDLGALAQTKHRSFLSGLGMHANELSLVLNSAFAIALFTARGASGWTRLALSASAALFASCVVLTFSRGGYLGMALVFTAYMLRSGSVRSLLVSAILFALALAALPEAAWNRLLLGVASGDRSAMSAGRLDDIWPHLITSIMESPFVGHGMQSILWSQPARQGLLSVAQPHNAYLGLLMDLGLAGFVLVIGFHVWAWRHIRQASAAVPQPFDREMLAGGAVTVLLLFVQGLTDDRFTPTVPQTYMWFAIGAAVGFRLRRGRHRHRRRQRPQQPALAPLPKEVVCAPSS
jgi:O-antigen ligase